jgi:hypothetical protein
LGWKFQRVSTFYSHFERLQNKHDFLFNDIIFLDFTKPRLNKLCWTPSAMPTAISICHIRRQS